LCREKGSAILKVEEAELFDFFKNGFFGEVFGFFIGLLCLVEHLAARVLEVADGLEEEFDFFVELVQQFFLDEGLLHFGL
jgi:hypothetical protein